MGESKSEVSGAYPRQPLARHYSLIISALFSLAACATLDASNDAKTLEWMPSQTDFLFSSNHEGNSEIYIRKAGAENFTNLTNSHAQENWPVWSPDGKRIVYQSRANGSLDVYVMNADGSGKQRLTANPAHDYVPTWSNDGQKIYFASWRVEEGDTNSKVHFYVMNTDGSQQDRLKIDSPETSGALDVSPDGSRIAYAKRVGDGQSVIRIRDIQSGLERELSTPVGYAGGPSFSPNGKHLAFYLQQGENSKIFTADATSGELTEVVSAGRNWEPKWSPDGQWLLVTVSSSVEDTDLDFWLVCLDADKQMQLMLDTDGRTSEGRWRPNPGNSY